MRATENKSQVPCGIAAGNGEIQRQFSPLKGVPIVKEFSVAHAQGSWRRRFSARGLARAILGFAAVLLLMQGHAGIHAATPAGKESGKPRKSQTPPWKAEDLRTIEDTIFQLTNSARKDKGLNPLARSPALAYLARGQSKNMCRVGKLIHESEDFPQGWRRFMQRLGMVRVRSGAENIAFHTRLADPRTWASAVVTGWQRSPPHAKNLFDPKWRYMGLWIEPCGDRTAYAAQEFSTEPGTVPESNEPDQAAVP